MREREKILVNGLVDIASSLGSGSVRPSMADSATRALRIVATQTLKRAGYVYQENPDGWVLAEEDIDENHE